MNVICGAKTRDGDPCKRWATHGKRRCHVHGGARGSGRPIIHGRTSTLRFVFGEKWDHALADPDLMRFEQDIALFVLREAELAQRLKDGDSPEFRGRAVELLAEFEAAATDPAAAEAALRELRRHLRAGHSHDEAWEAIERNAERRSAIAKSAWDAMTRAENAFTARELAVLLGRMLDIVRQELGEVDARRCALRFEEDIIGRVRPSAALPALDPGQTSN